MSYFAEVESKKSDDKEEEKTEPTPAPLSFIPAMDDATVSTFGISQMMD